MSNMCCIHRFLLIYRHFLNLSIEMPFLNLYEQLLKTVGFGDCPNTTAFDNISLPIDEHLYCIGVTLLYLLNRTLGHNCQFLRNNHDRIKSYSLPPRIGVVVRQAKGLCIKQKYKIKIKKSKYATI